MTAEEVRPALSVQHLSVVARGRGGTQPLVNEVSLMIAPGEILGIVGESGSGKSTLCRALARILPSELRVAGGHAQLGRTDLLGSSAAEVHRMPSGGIGMIFQEPRAALNPVMRVGDQIVEALRARQRMSRREARAAGVELLASLGMPDADERMMRFPHEFSGGQSQRLATAVALAGSPSVLLADEPTSALDVTTQAQILDLLRNLASERQMGIVIVSHNYAVVAQLCQRTMVMYGGRLVEEGPTAQLLAAPRHPYTAALIGALPSVDERQPRLAVIPGRAPLPGEITSGCLFRERCAHRQAICETAEMALQPVGDSHFSACARVRQIWPAEAEVSP